MTTITLPRVVAARLLTIVDRFQDNYGTVPAYIETIEELRAALTCTENAEKCTRSENVSKNKQKVYALGDVLDAERNRIEQNHLRSEYLTNKSKTDWSAS